MKTIPIGLAAPIAGEYAAMVKCIKVTRSDGVIFAFTARDRPITISGVTYLPAFSFADSAIRTNSDMTVDDTEILGVVDSSEITDADLRDGRFDHAKVEEFLADWSSP